MLTRTPQLRISGHGAGLRLRHPGSWQRDPLQAVHECCRASIALDKALGEAVREALATGASWRDIGLALGVSENAETHQDVINALGQAKSAAWSRYWK
ncbi:hypothetical protein [Kribbella sp. VKM Ac-2571]|uniref:hypothetical protein n=1 Tax=Kribbella sp. VKM Ac-2571 TaxID=2512222 RepID=UPI00105C331A|nr:hypothetical protein [Kribbella sp. VKM Ac-2571]